MIKRSYFYSGFIYRRGTLSDYFDGIITIESWFPKPLILQKEAREGIEKASIASTEGQKIIITTINRI